MPNPYPIALRERAVRAYETGTDTYAQVAARFEIGLNTLVRWVQRARATGEVAPFDRGGGWHSPVDLPRLHRLVADRPDRTTEELTRVYNRESAPAARVHRSSVLRALRRSGYVFKKNGRGRRSKIVRASKPNAERSVGGSPRSPPGDWCLWMNPGRIWRWGGRTRGSRAGRSWSSRAR